MEPYPPRVRRDLGVGPEGQLSPRAGPVSPTQSEITQWGWGFHTARGGIDPWNLYFDLRFVEAVELWKDF